MKNVLISHLATAAALLLASLARTIPSMIAAMQATMLGVFPADPG
jgi:hypothetical protein